MEPRIFYGSARREKDKGGQVFVRQKEAVESLAKLTTIGAARTGVVRLVTPSRRLSAMIEIFFVPDALSYGFVLTDSAGTWVINAQAISPQGNNYVALHQLISSAIPSTAAELALPNAYELDSAIRAIEVFGVFTNLPVYTDGITPTRFAGNWYARARWEPNTPMDDEELEFLFNGCSMSVSKVSS